VDVMSNAPQVEELEDEEPDYDSPMQTDSESEGAASRGGAYGEDDDDDALHMDVARVYENTLIQLGEAL
jgi:hypothetical protein